MRSLVPSVVGLLASLVAVSHAAPAPLPPRYARQAEAEFDLGTNKERARRVGLYLRSRAFLAYASRDDGVAPYLPDLDQPQRLAWLADNLTVTVGEDRVRLRLRGEAEALGVLLALAERLDAPHPDNDDGRWNFLRAIARREELTRRLELLRNLRERSPDRVPMEALEDAEAQLGRCEIESNPLRLLARPRRVMVRR